MSLAMDLISNMHASLGLSKEGHRFSSISSEVCLANKFKTVRCQLVHVVQ